MRIIRWLRDYWQPAFWPTARDLAHVPGTRRAGVWATLHFYKLMCEWGRELRWDGEREVRAARDEV